MLTDSYKIVLCITGLVITGSSCGIIKPNLVMIYTSLYFLQIMTSIQFVIFYGICYLCIAKQNISFPKKHIKTIFLCGLFNSLVSIFMIYSVNPKRTPILIQSLFIGSIILPSVITRKILIKRVIRYNIYYISASVALLLISISISIIPLYSKWTIMSFLWSLMYALGVIFMAIYNVLQEKYLVDDTGDTSINNKLCLMFYVRIFQFIILSTCFWLEYFIGYSKDINPFVLFYDNLKIMFTDYIAFILLESFIIAYIMLYWISVYLNSISTNYNMISSTIIYPLITIFFTIFHQLNPGIKFPLYIIIPSLALSILSTILWIKGERTTNYKSLN